MLQHAPLAGRIHLQEHRGPLPGHEQIDGAEGQTQAPHEAVERGGGVGVECAGAPGIAGADAPIRAFSATDGPDEGATVDPGHPQLLPGAQAGLEAHRTERELIEVVHVVGAERGRGHPRRAAGHAHAEGGEQLDHHIIAVAGAEGPGGGGIVGDERVGHRQAAGGGEGELAELVAFDLGFGGGIVHPAAVGEQVLEGPPVRADLSADGGDGGGVEVSRQRGGPGAPGVDGHDIVGVELADGHRGSPRGVQTQAHRQRGRVQLGVDANRAGSSAFERLGHALGHEEVAGVGEQEHGAGHGGSR